MTDYWAALFVFRQNVVVAACVKKVDYFSLMSFQLYFVTPMAFGATVARFARHRALPLDRLIPAILGYLPRVLLKVKLSTKSTRPIVQVSMIEQQAKSPLYFPN